MKSDFPENTFLITYIGHATTLIQIDNVNILTDPNFSDRVALLFKRYVAPGIEFSDLPEIDAIVISHEHVDHLNKPTLRQFRRGIPIVISKGLGSIIKKLGFQDVRELDWWEKTVVKDIEITAVPAHHDATNSGYIISGSKVIYFAGDTGLFPGFQDIGEQFNIDVALLPIGGYEPHFPGNKIPAIQRILRRDHLAPEDISEALDMLNQPILIPIHWGTFKLTGEPLDEPIMKLREIMKGNGKRHEIYILQPGESFSQ